MQSDKSHESAEFEQRADSRSGRRTDDEVIVQRQAIVADASPPDTESRSLPALDRRRRERRRIDRMSTGI
jgi:hypothetical protein